MNSFEWIVWTLLAIFTVVLFIAWSVKKRGYKKGRFYDTREVVTLVFVPRFVIAASALLTIFLFINVSKLHLIWIYLVIYFLINVKMAKRVSKADKERLSKEIEKQETKDE